MAAGDQLERLWVSLAGLGPRRLAALASVGLAIVAIVGIGSYYLSRADLEVLYVGLTPPEVARMGSVLHEAGVTFDVNAEATKVLVKRGEAARARMLLAERGLPNSSTAGYELFDKLGSMGLTSFMQNITRLRALEGEIARNHSGHEGREGRACSSCVARSRFLPARTSASFGFRRYPRRHFRDAFRRCNPADRLRRGSRNGSRSRRRSQHGWNHSRRWRRIPRGPRPGGCSI